MTTAADSLEVTQREFGEWIGVSTQRVVQLTAEGVVPKAPSGRIPLKKAVLSYCERMRRSAAGRASTGDLDLTTERARLAKEQADGTALKNAVVRGEYVKAIEVERRWSDNYRAVQAHMLSVSSKVQQRLAGLTRHDIEEFDRVIREALNEAAAGVEQAATQGAGDADLSGDQAAA